jgi:hypothetical protein
MRRAARVRCPAARGPRPQPGPPRWVRRESVTPAASVDKLEPGSGLDAIGERGERLAGVHPYRTPPLSHGLSTSR